MDNPGSKEAVEKGCLCAVMDNSYGKGIPGSESLPDGPHFYINGLCPLHGIQQLTDLMNGELK